MNIDFIPLFNCSSQLIAIVEDGSQSDLELTTVCWPSGSLIAMPQLCY